VADRPLVGIGPGRFVEASSPRRDLVSVRYEGRDVLMADAHNVFVEILTTTGLLGLLAFATWLLLAAGGARGALAGFAALVGFTLLLEPLDLAVVPVAALALGAATVAGARAPAPPRLTRIAVVTGAVLALAGVVLGARLVAGDVAYASAVRSSSLTDVERAERLSPPWPQYPGLEAALLDRAGSTLGDPGLGARAMVVQRTAIDRDPSDPRWWYGMGELEQRWGSDARARRDYLAALQRNPWSYSALSRLYGLELRAGHRETALRFRARLCSIGPSECPPSPEVMEQQARTKPAAHPRASTR
jgi:hypothetical protein